MLCSAFFLEILSSYSRDVLDAYSKDGETMPFEEFTAFADVILDNAVGVVLEEMSVHMARNLMQK